MVFGDKAKIYKRRLDKEKSAYALYTTGVRKYAWLPKRMGSGIVVWLEHYWERKEVIQEGSWISGPVEDRYREHTWYELNKRSNVTVE